MAEVNSTHCDALYELGEAVAELPDQTARDYETHIPPLEAEGAPDLVLMAGYSAHLVPGTLQTEEFGGKMLRYREREAGGAELPDPAVERFVRAGIKRQRSLLERPVVQLWLSRAMAFEVETAARYGISPEVHESQIRSILYRLTIDRQRNKVDLRIIPNEAYQRVADIGLFMLQQTGDFDVRAFQDTANQVQEVSAEPLQQAWRRLRDVAMDSSDSVAFLRSQVDS